MVQIFCGYTGLVNFITCLSLAIFLFLKNRSGKINKIFALWSASVAFWSLGYFMWLWTPDQGASLFWARFLMAGAIIIPSSFLHFTLVYLKLDQQHQWVINAAYIFSAVYLLLDFTPYFILTVEPRYWFRWWPVPGSLYHPYQVFFILSVLYTHILLFKQAHTAASSITRKQFKIVAYGTLIAFTGGSTNFFLWYNIPIPPIFNFLVTGYVVFIAYAILNYRLWDIEVIIKKTLVFSGVLTMAMLVVSIVSTFSQGYLGQYIKVGNNISTLLSVLIAIVLYKPTHGFLIRATDKFLFQRKQEIKITLKRLSEQVTSIADVDQIAKTILSTLRDAMRLESGMMILQNKKQNNYHIAEHFGFVGEDLTQSIRAIVKDPLIVKNFSDRGSVVNLDYHGISELPKHVLDWLDAAKVRVVIPLFINDDKFGLMVLGKKKSDQEFKQEEIDYFPVIASQTSLAIRNALLIQDVVHEREAKVRAEHLAERVKFARTIKHEVKNALAGIEGPARFLSMYHTPDLKKAFKEKDEEWFDEICEKINKQVSEKIYKGVEKVFDIAETSLGGLDEEDQSLRRIYFKILWDEAKEESGVLKKCDFESTIPDGFIIYGKYHALQRVLVNLITNAFDAMKNQDRKSICLKCSYEEVDGQSVASFEFRDSGPGIPKEAHTKVFEQGFSTKPKPDSQDRLASGYGQGLYVCKTTLEKMHSGKMWIENVEGQGAIFKFWLPMKGAAGAE